MALRVIGALVGDVVHEPSARTKYGLLFRALARRFDVVEVYDATLRGAARWLNAAQVFHPNPAQWRERFYQNIPAFQTRSRRAAAHLQMIPADVILQVGVLFNASVPNHPTVIYTDYTARLAAQNRWQGRSPFTPQQRERWIALEGQAFQQAHHICTRGRFVADSIINDYALPPDRVTTIGGGVNFETLPRVPDRPATPAPTVLFIGKEFYRKGGDRLLRAFARAREQTPQARLVMMTGDALPADLPQAGVEVLAPTWERAAIARLYQQADIFVLPSRLETWGDVLLEAMAYGLPCVGVAGQAMEEIIEHDQTGLVTPADDDDALALALGDLLTHADLRRRLGQAARLRIETRYTWEQVVEQLAPALEAAAVTTRTH